MGLINKIVAIGDTHGRSKWKTIIEKEKDADKIIFIGDYFDSKDGHSGKEQIQNFKDIIQFKKDNFDKVILLIGNHDFHYLRGVNEEYSGYQWGNSKNINKVLQPVVDEGLLQICHQEDKYFFSHAGVTKTWCDNSKIDKNNLQESINNLFKTNIERFRFTMGDNLSFGGNDVTQPPIWVRPQSLVKDMVEGIVCVVGHSQVNNVTIMEDDNLILIDCLGFTDSYLIIENNIPIIGVI